jgi:hypothetical protein
MAQPWESGIASDGAHAGVGDTFAFVFPLRANLHTPHPNSANGPTRHNPTTISIKL